LDVKIADEPLSCVARGTSNYLENLDLFKDTLESDADSV
jgi:actin-like ATPase involved in cell morphogenesis